VAKFEDCFLPCLSFFRSFLRGEPDDDFRPDVLRAAPVSATVVFAVELRWDDDRAEDALFIT
jgi:hypothetical protein|tara:strand:- start:7 stop:192 length:186 start_codon:yes stop_codon:yes gene_type:complete